MPSQARHGKSGNSDAVTSSTEGLQVDEEATPENEWRELKDAVAHASQAHLGKTRRRRRDWVTNETIALAEQARLMRIQRAPNYRDLRRQTTG